MANPRLNNGWEDKKRPMSRNDTSINKRPRLDVRVVSSTKWPTSPLKNTSPTKLFRRSTSLPSSSRDSPSPTDEILLSAAKASEEEEAKAARELNKFFGPSNESKFQSKIDPQVPSTTKTVSNLAKVVSKPLEAQQTGNNGSSGFDKLFCDEINEDFVEECMNLATALSQQPKESTPPAMSQAYEYFFKGVQAHSSILEKTISKPVPTKPPLNTGQSSEFRPPANRPRSSAAEPSTSSSSSYKLTVNSSNQPFRKPPPPVLQKSQLVSKLKSIPEEKPQSNPPGAEAVIRRLELEVERLTVEKKEIKETQNTKDGEAAVLRFQVQEGQNKMKQLKATHDQALLAMNEQYNEKLRNLHKENENLRSQLQVQVMENNAARERSKLLELSHSRSIRLVEPQSPLDTASPNTSIAKNQKIRRPSAFLNRSTFEEDLRSPPRSSEKPSPSGHDLNVQPETSHPNKQDGKKVESDGLLYRFDVPERTVGCSLALRLAGWERIKADDSDDFNSSCSARQAEYDTDSSLDLLKIGPARNRKRTKVFNETDRPGLAACLVPLRTIFLWPEATLESPAAQHLLRKIAVECCGLVHYKFILLKDHEMEMDEKILYERDCDIVERGGQVLDLKVEMDLLDDRPWYKGEHGISSRRALGLLSELAFVSSTVSALLTGSLASHQPPLERHSFTKLPDFADDCSVKNSSLGMQSAKSEQQKAGDRMETGARDDTNPVSDDSTCNHPDRYWFLEILAELCFTIAKQKRTNQFNGVFVGLLTLLQNCARNGGIVGEARPIVLRIIRGVLLARPAFYTLRCLLHLLKQLSDCEDLMTGLCTYDEHDNYQEDLNHKLFYFRSDSCILQLLCAQVNSAGKSRWFLADPMVRWLLAVFAHTTVPPRWLVPHISSMRQDGDDAADNGHSLCCPRIISTAITLIYEAFQTLRDHLERDVTDFTNPCDDRQSDRQSPISMVMQRSLILLHTLVVNDLSEYIGRVEGDYDIFIPGLNRLRQRLNLASSHEKHLDDLVKIEKVADPPGAIDPGAEDVISERVWDGAVKGSVLP